MQKGFTKIDKDLYYFDETTGELKTGWLNIDGKTYYAPAYNGKISTGLEVIELLYFYTIFIKYYNLHKGICINLKI